MLEESPICNYLQWGSKTHATESASRSFVRISLRKVSYAMEVDTQIAAKLENFNNKFWNNVTVTYVYSVPILVNFHRLLKMTPQTVDESNSCSSMSSNNVSNHSRLTSSLSTRFSSVMIQRPPF